MQLPPPIFSIFPTAHEIKEARALQRKRHFETILRINSGNSMSVLFAVDGTMSLADNRQEMPLTPLNNEIFSMLSAEPLTAAVEHWIKMQVRWIVWTLASLERRSVYKYMCVLLSKRNIAEAVAYRLATYSRCVSESPFKDLAIANTPHARRRFAKQGSMSPLQRCTDIASMVWPLVLCFSCSGASDNMSLEVTDGWWWTRASIDAQLHSQVQKGKLFDGCRIAVFAATFTTEGETTLKLSFNGTKKASKRAPFGFIRPSYLQRGLSVRSISADGGAVFGVTVEVLHIAQSMIKFTKHLKMPLSQGKQKQQQGQAEVVQYILDMSEIREMRNQLDRQRCAQQESVVSDDEMSLDSLLCNLGCDDWVAKIIKAHSNGDGRDELSETEEREVHRAMQKFEVLRQQTAERLMREMSNTVEMQESSYVDVLTRCTTSGAECWVRFNMEGPESAPQLVKGTIVFLSNLRPLRTMSSVPALLTTRNTELKKIGFSNAIGRSLSVSFEPLGSLRLFLNSFPSAEDRNGREVSIMCRVVFWREESQKEDGGQSFLDIICTDDSRVSVVLRYPVPSEVRRSLSWLVVGQWIEISLGLLKSIDVKHEILLVTRHDRTMVRAVASREQVADALKQIVAAQDEAERNRYLALRSNRTTFSVEAESCERFRIGRVAIHACKQQGTTFTCLGFCLDERGTQVGKELQLSIESHLLAPSFQNLLTPSFALEQPLFNVVCSKIGETLKVIHIEQHF